MLDILVLLLNFWSLGSHVGISVSLQGKLQALVYDILPSVTAVFSYVIRSRKLSAGEQFFVGNVRRIGRMFPEHVERSFFGPRIPS